ncbi:hypothetical protein ACFQYP_43160 [Nonomuraea antimicrobica]
MGAERLDRPAVGGARWMASSAPPMAGSASAAAQPVCAQTPASRSNQARRM